MLAAAALPLAQQHYLITIPDFFQAKPVVL
jgi:hypothetical protein